MLGDSGFNPRQGTKIPQAVEQLGPHTTTREPEWRSYWAHALWQKSVQDAAKIPPAATDSWHSQYIDK